VVRLLDIFKSPPWADATGFKYFIVGFEPTLSPTFATAVLMPTFLKVFAPLAGFEPTTLELTALCSTAELKGNIARLKGIEPLPEVLETYMLPLTP
jgi:hypothetical protein